MDLRTHIEQLKALYGYLDKGYLVNSGAVKDLMSLAVPSILTSGLEYTLNPNYPAESVEDFIAKLIDKKKKRIQIILDVLGL